MYMYQGNKELLHNSVPEYLIKYSTSQQGDCINGYTAIIQDILWLYLCLCTSDMLINFEGVNPSRSSVVSTAVAICIYTLNV